MKIDEYILDSKLENTHEEERYVNGIPKAYQKGSVENRERFGEILDRLILSGSRIEDGGNLEELFRRSEYGQSCLLLAEHYSNLDFPLTYRLIEKNIELGIRRAASTLPIRGLKLSEESEIIAAATHSYDNIVIYPSRYLDSIQDPHELEEIRKMSVPINHAAMREMIKRKHNGRLIIVFPSGTRYRPWKTNSRKGAREIYSYIKTFDNILFLSINGNLSPPHRSDKMSEDEIQQDLIILKCSKIVNGPEFKREMQEACPEGEDKRAFVVSSIMSKLLKMHEEVEPRRLKEKALLKESDYSEIK